MSLHIDYEQEEGEFNCPAMQMMADHIDWKMREDMRGDLSLRTIYYPHTVAALRTYVFEERKRKEGLK